MLWRFSVLVLLLLTAPTGCGFSPMYAKNAASGIRPLSGIEISPIPGRNGQLLKASLEDIFNPEAEAIAATHLLEMHIKVDYIPVIIESDGTVSRYRIDFTVPFSLRDSASNQIVHSDIVRNSVSYSVSESDYTSYVSSTDAIERGIVEISHDIAQRVSAYLLKK